MIVHSFSSLNRVLEQGKEMVIVFVMKVMEEMYVSIVQKDITLHIEMRKRICALLVISHVRMFVLKLGRKGVWHAIKDGIWTLN